MRDNAKVVIDVLQLQVLAQAIEDILRFELGLPLIAAKTKEEAEQIYFEAYEFLQMYPSVLYRISSHNNKQSWLEDIDNARFTQSLREEGKRQFIRSRSKRVFKLV